MDKAVQKLTKDVESFVGIMESRFDDIDRAFALDENSLSVGEIFDAGTLQNNISATQREMQHLEEKIVAMNDAIRNTTGPGTSLVFADENSEESNQLQQLTDR